MNSDPPPQLDNGHDGAELGKRVAELEARVRTLEAETEQSREVLDGITDHAIFAFNLGGRVTRANAGAECITGYPPETILGRSGEVLFPAEDRVEGVFVGELLQAMDGARAPNERWHLRRDGSRFWASGSMLPLRDGSGRTKGFLNVFRDHTAAQAARERQALLLSEMTHRAKNTLATAQAVAVQTLHSAGVPREVQQALSARLQALAHAHDLLARGDGRGEASLAEVVGRALSPYGAERTDLEGLPVSLPANAVEMLGLAFHELATNAAKYGALSVPDGRVAVRWSLHSSLGGGRRLELTWSERGGPPVVPPVTRGFGSRLLERGLVLDLGGTVKLDFCPEGLECRIGMPIAMQQGD